MQAKKRKVNALFTLKGCTGRRRAGEVGGGRGGDGGERRRHGREEGVVVVVDAGGGSDDAKVGKGRGVEMGRRLHAQEVAHDVEPPLLPRSLHARLLQHTPHARTMST
jgi:hypothetical protein